MHTWYRAWQRTNTREQLWGVTFDGTGYGPVWTDLGRGFLLGDESGYERVGSIAPFIHAGGDIASREGWRIATP